MDSSIPLDESRLIPAHAGNRSFTATRSGWPTVHPRARGEQIGQTKQSWLSIGSSPRTRGTVGIQRGRSLVKRFIPAHAGNSRPCTRRASGSAVHPRARGEQQSSLPFFWRGCGSSPRTRGTGRHEPDSGRARRFIPAHAGNRLQSSRRAAGRGVHPRARGEQRQFRMSSALYDGSSPRTRGTGRPHRRSARRCRFIPAHAGNSAGYASRGREPAVHPRARGEQDRPAEASPSWAGSSPRTRGTVARGQNIEDGARFIPAHAGNSTAKSAKKGVRSVHPRARGEQSLTMCASAWASGSSPRTRGTAHAAASHSPKLRFIPAHAGNRSARPSRATRPAVHPRARGEQETTR